MTINDPLREKIQRSRSSTLDFLGRIEEAICRLASTYGSLIDAGPTRTHLAKLRVALENAKKAVGDPLLSIAFIGTTSSGKSTLVNALGGRRLAPTEAQELSAGILRIQNSPLDQLHIDSQNIEQAIAYCNSNPSDNILHLLEANKSGFGGLPPDDDTFYILRSVMLGYLKAAKTNLIAFPQVLISTQLKPATDTRHLGFVNELKLRLDFVDLPGLKSATDSRNKEVIQTFVKQSFLFCVLDYSQTDDKTRLVLLQELEDIVSQFNGDSKMILFVLNRIDIRDSKDHPLQQRLQTLQAEINTILKLPHLPTIIPTQAQLMGWVEHPTLETLKEIARAKITAEYGTPASKEWRMWRTKADEWIDSGSMPAESDPDWLAFRAFFRRISGFDELWTHLRHRIDKEIDAFLFFPPLNPVFELLEDLTSDLEAVISIRMTSSTKALDELKTYLEETKKNIARAYEHISYDLADARKRLETYQNNRLESDDENQPSDIKGEYLQWKEQNATGYILKLATAVEAGEKFVHDLKQDLGGKVLHPALQAIFDFNRVTSLKGAVSPYYYNTIESKVRTIIKYRNLNSDQLAEKSANGELSKAFYEFDVHLAKAIGERAQSRLQGALESLNRTFAEIFPSFYEELMKALPQTPSESEIFIQVRHLFTCPPPGVSLDFNQDGFFKSDKVDIITKDKEVIQKKRFWYFWHRNIKTIVQVHRFPTFSDLERPWLNVLQTGYDQSMKSLFAHLRERLPQLTGAMWAQMQESSNIIEKEIDAQHHKASEKIESELAFHQSCLALVRELVDIRNEWKTFLIKETHEEKQNA
jgi:GTPase SAR1 family protein